MNVVRCFLSHCYQVALRACEYARERRLFGNTFFVSLQEESTGAPITELKDVATRIADAFGISTQVLTLKRVGLSSVSRLVR